VRVTFYGYGDKGLMVAAALVDAGHELAPDGGEVAVVDFDWRGDVAARHERVVVYPHGGNPLLCWDGQYPPHPNTRLMLTHSRGHAQVMQAYGYSKPLASVGWCYSELAPQRYDPDPRTLLFGPVHPTGHGYLSEDDARDNRRAMQAAKRTGLRVTVRCTGRPEDCGLRPDADVRWTTGGSLRHDDIDKAGVVLAQGTLAFLAAARGAPLITFGSGHPPDLANGGPGDEPVRPRHWEAYERFMRHPLDLDHGAMEGLVHKAVRPSPEVDHWRSKFIEPFKPNLLAKMVERVATEEY
jgi:hypothetical protein